MHQERPHKYSSLSRARAVKADTFNIISNALHKAGAHNIIDFGCGHGEMAAKLAASGFRVTGIDPSEEALDKARQINPQAHYLTGTAEAPPVPLASFDAAYFLNSLHHVPPALMQKAVLSAIDTVRENGIVLVIEPMAAGSFFRAMRPVEDESEIRGLAVQVIDKLIAGGIVQLTDLQRWDRENSFSSLEDFTSYLLRVDPLRADSVTQNSIQLAKAWRDNVTIREGRAYLAQPLVCWTLMRR